MASVEEVQRYALSLVGAPYVLGCEPWYDIGWEPSNIETASDCSGLVYAVMRRAGIPWRSGGTWPRLTADGYAQHCVRIPRSEVRCGDVALFAGKSGHVYHIALVIDRDWTVEARGRAWGVVTYKIDDPINGVVRRGAYFGRFPWVEFDLEEDEMDEATVRQIVRSEIEQVWAADHVQEAQTYLLQEGLLSRTRSASRAASIGYVDLMLYRTIQRILKLIEGSDS